MKTTYDTDKIIFDILNKSPVKQAITGGIYFQGDRPDDSTAEDIVINTIALTQAYIPQLATSNVNIFVSDKPRRINGVEQLKPNHRRLSELTRLVLDALRAAEVEGLIFIPESQAILEEVSVKQHSCNIRLSWNIH